MDTFLLQKNSLLEEKGREEKFDVYIWTHFFDTRMRRGERSDTKEILKRCVHMYISKRRDTRWRRPIGYLKLQVSSAKEPLITGLFCGK